MKQFFPLVFFSFAAMLFAQDSPPKFDGVINQEEWKNAQVFLLDYEIDPETTHLHLMEQKLTSSIPLLICM